LLVNVWGTASMQVTVFFALFSCLEHSVTEPAEFAYIHDCTFFRQLIYHSGTLRGTEIWLEDRFYIEISRLKHPT